jgi:hypothetical protein
MTSKIGAIVHHSATVGMQQARLAGAPAVKRAFSISARIARQFVERRMIASPGGISWRMMWGGG